MKKRMDSFNTLKLEKKDEVMLLTLALPGKRNAMTEELTAEF